MIIIGYDLVSYQKHYLIHSIKDIKQTPPNAVVHLEEFDGVLMQYLFQNSLSYSVAVKNKTQLLLANALGASFIISSDAKKDQEIATNYLFDAKVLTFINNIDEIENLVDTNIDGVIFKDAIITSY